MNVVCCQVDVRARGRSLVQRSPTECGVSECDFETGPMTAFGLQENNSQQNIKSVTTLWADLLKLLVLNQERCERISRLGCYLCSGIAWSAIM